MQKRESFSNENTYHQMSAQTNEKPGFMHHYREFGERRGLIRNGPDAQAWDHEAVVMTDAKGHIYGQIIRIFNGALSPMLPVINSPTLD